LADRPVAPYAANLIIRQPRLPDDLAWVPAGGTGFVKRAGRRASSFARCDCSSPF